MNFSTLADSASLTTTTTSLKQKGYDVTVVKDGAAALEQVKKLIPARASVMNGASTTLEQIGYQAYLAEGKHDWVDLHAQITAENDDAKRAQLRKESVLSDFYVGSVHALMENGDLLIASNTGSQLPHIVYTSPNLIFVVSTKKIVPDLSAAMQRLEEHVIPLEDARMQQAYHMGTTLNKYLIVKGDAPMLGRKIHFILVEADLGF